MAQCRIKFVIFLMTMLCLTECPICVSEPNSPQSSEAIAPQSTSVNNSNNSWQFDPNSTWSFPKSTDNNELFSSAVKAIIIVIILCVAIIFISKKLLPKISNLRGRRIQIIETVHLTQRKSLHLIKIDNLQLLIGSTNENITKLAELTDLLNNTFELQISDIEENNDQSKN
ncbi:MAG TPA: flagellar biosynthetic protein FliO [Sedimentisphaerales bacterium]|nr:flagellar biosynthetic protein FliO [Sedimentisphaerales bacterium]